MKKEHENRYIVGGPPITKPYKTECILIKAYTSPYVRLVKIHCLVTRTVGCYMQEKLYEDEYTASEGTQISMTEGLFDIVVAKHKLPCLYKIRTQYPYPTQDGSYVIEYDQYLNPELHGLKIIEVEFEEPIKRKIFTPHPAWIKTNLNSYDYYKRLKA